MVFHSGRHPERGARARDFKVTVHSRSGANVQGRVEHVTSREIEQFDSFLELTSLVTGKLEELDLVRPSTEIRAFHKLHALGGREGRVNILRDHYVKEKTAEEQVGSCSNFLIRILLRQNATWQGEVHWLDTDKVVRFRSLLEMVMLMQEAMDTSGEPKVEYEFRSWLGEKQLPEKQTAT
jgi:hypothetical protein